MPLLKTYQILHGIGHFLETQTRCGGGIDDDRIGEFLFSIIVGIVVAWYSGRGWIIHVNVNVVVVVVVISVTGHQ